METNIEQLKYPIGKFQRPGGHNIESRTEWIQVLKALPSWIDLSLENLDHDQLNTPYRDGGWNIRQVVHHLADSHINAYVRLKLALTEENPAIKVYDEKGWAELADCEITPVNVSATLLHALHRRWTDLLEHLDEASWDRTYFHPVQQRSVPVWEMTALYAWHSRHHTGHIMGLRNLWNIQ